MQNKRTGNKIQPDHLLFYFRLEWIPLIIVTISGLIYNIGLTAGPYFEGQLAQKLCDIIQKKSVFSEMIPLAMSYVLILFLVQSSRCFKRFYVRRFANDTSRNMRHVLYHYLVHQSKNTIEQESVGTLMTKAIADVDACAEGMRKFLTEVFDTGIALLAYLTMMFLYDWRLALCSSLFTLIAYFIAEKIKVFVYRCNSSYKKSASALNDATMERIEGAMTYRVFGQEENRNTAYEEYLKEYEHKAVMANIWENSLTPIYRMISMTGVIFILYFGGKNVLGTGYRQWDIAAFTAFLSCFTKTAVKSSKAAKLFNAVQKAQVSWKRIKPLMKEPVPEATETNFDFQAPVSLIVQDLRVRYTSLESTSIFEGLHFQAEAGDWIGITGPVACGKSTLGKVLLGELSYEGTILVNGTDFSLLSAYERNHLISYLGHQPELMTDTISNNISYGDRKEITPYLDAVCMDLDLSHMPEGAETEIGSRGTRLSGGQQDRLALARTLYHGKKIFVLDDPFSAVDASTEEMIMHNLKEMAPDAIFLIFSHRVTHFTKFKQIIWMENGQVTVGSHEELLVKEPRYRTIFETQMQGGDFDVE